MKIIDQKSVFFNPWLLLLLWVAIGTFLRFLNLAGKPPWTDEFATIMLSLGQSFKSVSLDRAIDFQELLKPLIPNPHINVADVTKLVLREENHPPTYFALAHLWLKFFPPVDGLVSMWAARAFPALLGILAIPISYFGAYLIFKSRPIAHLTAAMMAVSPYGVYISQEARHYSLAILWIVISLSCLAIATQYLRRQEKLPILLVITWIVVNNLGMATHYFFAIALLTEILTLGWFLGWQILQPKGRAAFFPLSGTPDRNDVRSILLHPSWQRLYVVMLGTLVGLVTWLLVLRMGHDSTMTSWMKNEPQKLIEVFNPLFQIIGALIPMMSLLFVEVSNLTVVIVSGLIMLLFFVWVTPLLKRGLRYQWSQPETQVATGTILIFASTAIGLYLIAPWVTGVDITRGARFHFVYYPSIIILIGLALGACCSSQNPIAKWVSGKQAIAIVLIMGLVSSAIVSTNYGFRKYYRPEQLTPLIATSAPIPVLIATTHNSFVQVGEMMGLAWEMRRTDRINQKATTKFLFAHQNQTICEGKDCVATKILRQEIDRLPQPQDLWLLNFRAPVNLPPNCHQDKQYLQGIYGYEHKLYHCDNIKDIGYLSSSIPDRAQL